MNNGVIIWVIGLVICIGVFLNGLRFARMSKNTWADKSLSTLPIEKVNRIGKTQMVFAPLFLIFWTLLWFGVFGPIEGIQTIKLK